MKIVLNRCFGIPQLSADIVEVLNLESEYNFDPLDSQLISLVEASGPMASGRFAKLEVHEIPEESTDWLLETYDGYERVIYVLNGKIQII